MLHDFEQDSENISAWMDTVETTLQRKQNAHELRIHQQSIAVCQRFETRGNKFF